MRKYGVGLVAVMVCLTGTISAGGENLFTVQAASAIVYDADTDASFPHYTIEEIADAYTAAVYAGETYNNNDSSSWYVSQPNLTAPYDAGELTQDTHNAMTAMTNFYRWLMGNQPYQTTSQHSDQLQAGALIRKFNFNHIVNDAYQPADMSDELWQYGADCTHNILANGYTPVDAITGWMNEGYNVSRESWDTIGHRVMLVQADVSGMQYGYSGAVAIGNITGYKNSKVVPFAAFPAAGYMPSNLVVANECAWSVEPNSEQIEIGEDENITATITNLNTGATWVRTEADETLRVAYECVTFAQPTDFTEDGYTDAYAVEITGLQDADTGEDVEIRYTVNFFDMSDYATYRVREVNFHMQYGVGPDMMNLSGLRKIAAILPTTVPVTAENGETYTVPVTGKWTVDMENNCFVNTGDASALPSNIDDHYGLLEQVTIPFYEKTGYTAIYDTLDIYPNIVQAGESVNVSVYRTNASTDRVQVYKIREDSDGTYDSVKKYDSSNEQVEGIYRAAGTVADTYTITSAGAADNGNYLSVYFNQSWIDGGNTVNVFVSNAVSDLTVETVTGDVNEDGAVGMTDAVALKKILMGLASEHLDAADCNKDGRVNVFDMIFLKDALRNAA
jgi:hypothetical protein